MGVKEWLRGGVLLELTRTRPWSPFAGAMSLAAHFSLHAACCGYHIAILIHDALDGRHLARPLLSLIRNKQGLQTLHTQGARPAPRCGAKERPSEGPGDRLTVVCRAPSFNSIMTLEEYFTEGSRWERSCWRRRYIGPTSTVLRCEQESIDCDMPDVFDTDLTTLPRTHYAAVAYPPRPTTDMPQAAGGQARSPWRQIPMHPPTPV